MNHRLALRLHLLLLTGTVSGMHAGARPPHDVTGNTSPLHSAYSGGLVTPPFPKPTFVLTDTSGARFDFQSRTNGYGVTLLFFGYTNCPDICPMHMSILASALRKLPKDLQGQTKVIFVTTDPDRDSPQVLQQWLNSFSKDFVGLTGSKAEIQSAQMAAKLPIAKGAPGYDHAAFVVVYTRDNLAHLIYPSGIGESDWLHDLPQLAKETWKKR